MLSASGWIRGCQGAGKEVPSPPLSGRAYLMFLTVIAASVWVNSSREVVTGRGAMKSKINVSYYETLILLCLG